MNFKSYLIESQEINLAMKQFEKLSSIAKNAIISWERENWHRGELEKAFKNKNALSKEIIDKFSPVREFLRNKYGNSIKLFRGVNLQYKEEFQAVLSSWTSDRKIAEYFANLRISHNGKLLSNLYNEISDEEIDKIVRNYEKTGFAQFGRYKFKKQKNSEYYDIYRDREYVTDGNDLFAHLKDEQDFAERTNKSRREEGKILNDNIKIDRIVWLTNRLNSKEFIVANYDLI